MLLLLVRRLAAAAVLVWAVASVTFLLIRLAPGDAADLLAPPSASAADAAELRRELGLDRPLAEQYGRWLARLVRGDLGESFAQRRSVRAIIAEAAPVSLALGGASLALSFVVGTAIGVVQGARRGSRLDGALTVLTTTAYAAPSFWLALALVALFTYGATVWSFPLWLRLPAFGVRAASGELQGAAAVVDLVRHAVLPVTVLTVVGAAGVARYARSAVADLVRAEWVRTARAKGNGWSRVYGRHVVANALPPLVVLLALALPGTIGGSVFVETVFAWPGMGRVLVAAIAARDYPVVLAVTVLYATMVILANLAADLALPLVDPRRRDARRPVTRLARAAAALLIVLTVLVVAVPLAARVDPLEIGDVLRTRLQPPLSRGPDGSYHLLGTDRFGRDLFVRIMLAGRVSLLVGVLGSVAAAAIGTAVGAAAGWRGGLADRAVVLVSDALLSIPRLVLLLVCAALWQPGAATVVAVLAATGWMGVARLVRGEVQGARGQPYAAAAHALGASPRRVLWRHVLPNAIGPAIVATTLGVGNAILLESGLSFLGLGIQPPQPSWGNMIAGGRDLIVTAPWVAVAPGLALVLTVLACTLLGDALRDRLAGEQDAAPTAPD